MKMQWLWIAIGVQVVYGLALIGGATVLIIAIVMHIR